MKLILSCQLELDFFFDLCLFINDHQFFYLRNCLVFFSSSSVKVGNIIISTFKTSVIETLLNDVRVIIKP
jgi:hypothetical protein